MKNAIQLCLLLTAFTFVLPGCSDSEPLGVGDDEIVRADKADDLFSEHVFDPDTASCNSAFFCGFTLGRAFPNDEGLLPYCSCQADCREQGDCCSDFADSCEASLAPACEEDAQCGPSEACVDGACELPACHTLDAVACDLRLSQIGDCDLTGFEPAEDAEGDDAGDGCGPIEIKACNRIFADTVCEKRVDCSWDGSRCE